MEQLQKWQTNSKQLIANVYLQYCMNCAIKTHITCIFFSLTPVNSPWSVSQSFTKYIHFKVSKVQLFVRYKKTVKNWAWYCTGTLSGQHRHGWLDSGSIMNAPGTAGTITVQIKTSRPGNCHSFFQGVLISLQSAQVLSYLKFSLGLGNLNSNKS